MPLSEQTQHHALAAYLGLLRLRPSWQRSLVLLDTSPGTGPTALAARAAGAAVLLTLPHTSSLRQANEDGVTDFNVTTLPEAIRILKNELRKGTSVSVGLLQEEGRVWQEIVTRGLQPQALLASQPEHDESAQILFDRGAVSIASLNAASEDGIVSHQAHDWRKRRAADDDLRVRASQLDDQDRTLAIRWLAVAPSLFPRDLHRCYLERWVASNPA